MTQILEATFNGVSPHLDEPLHIEPNMCVRIIVETPPDETTGGSFSQTARSLNLQDPSDWTTNFTDNT